MVGMDSSLAVVEEIVFTIQNIVATHYKNKTSIKQFKGLHRKIESYLSSNLYIREYNAEVRQIRDLCSIYIQYSLNDRYMPKYTSIYIFDYDYTFQECYKNIDNPKYIDFYEEIFDIDRLVCTNHRSI
jgi:hypothetical protein